MFSFFFHRKTTTANPTTPQVEDQESQQGSSMNTSTQSSGIEGDNRGNKRSLPESSLDEHATNPTPTKVSRFELETTEEHTWELPEGLFEYVDKYLTNHVADKVLKAKVSECPKPHNLKTTPILDGYIRELLMENHKHFTVNHEESLKNIQDRIGHVFGPLLQLWAIMDEEKEVALEDLRARGEDTSHLNQISALFEQSVSFLCQAFNSTSYHRRKSILETLIDGKTKVRDILKEQSQLLNNADNKFLFGPHFESEFTKAVTAKQKSKALFTGLKKNMYNPGTSTSNRSNQFSSQPFRGSSLPRSSRGRGQLFTRAFHRGGKNKLSINTETNGITVTSRGLSKCPSTYKEPFFSKGNSTSSISREVETFYTKLGKDNFRSNYFGLCQGLQNSTFRCTNSKFLTSSDKNDRGGETSSTKGNRRDAEKESDSSSDTRIRTISKLNLYSPKESRRLSSCNKPKETELLCGIRTFQNGGTFSFERSLRERQFSLQTGSFGCLLFSTSSQGLTEICKISMGGETIPISLPVFWSFISTKDFHKAYENPNITPPQIEYCANSVSGRHPFDCTNGEGNANCKGYIDFFVTKSGVSDQCEKISTSTLSQTRIPRGDCGYEGDDLISSTGESLKNSRTMSTYAFKRPGYSQGDFTTTGETMLFSNCSTSRTPSLQVNSKATDPRIFDIQKFRKESSLVKGSEGRTAMVDSQPPFKQRKVTIDLKTPNADNIRCFNERLGGFLPGTQNRGALVKLGSKRTYQCTRVKSSNVCNNDIHKNVSGSKVDPFADGQHSSSFIYKKDGGYPQQSSFKFGQGHLGLLDKKWDHDYCRIFTGDTQCGGRPTIPVSFKLKRMETKPPNLQKSLLCSVDTQHRPLCIKNVKSSSNLPVLETGSVQQRGRCLPTVVEKPKRLCISPILSHRESLEKSSDGHGHNNSDNTSLAKSSLVPKGSSNEYKKSNFDSQSRKPIIESGRPKTPSCDKQNTSVSGLGSFREKLSSEGLSEQAISLISDSRRKGTIRHYESSWGKWYSWCSERSLDPFRCDINSVIEFLTDLFQKGLEYNTICGYRSAISAYHEPMGSFKVGEHPHVSKLMTGIFNNRPTKPRYTFIWDVETVEKFLDTLDSNKLELKLLTYKLTMLLALAESCRAHEICLLNIDYLVRHSTSYRFHFSKPTKTSRPGKIRPPVKFVSFPANKNLCPCHHIDLYIEKTKNIRKGENQLLLATISPHEAVCSQTISNWLVKVLSLAGVDTSTFKGHSTRTASSSKAKALGVPTKEILRRGHWSRYSTFQKHYYKEIVD